MTIEEQKVLFSPCSNLSYSEAFEILDADGVNEISWDDELNGAYLGWVYFNIK